MSRPSYSDYRRWGHNPLTAVMLATPSWVILLIGLGLGALIGLIR